RSTQEGKTPLHFAAFAGHKAIAELLLEAKANANATDVSKATPLHYAALNGFKALVETLLANGADPNLLSFRRSPVMFGKTSIFFPGGTALHIAAENHRAITDLLLSKGANIESLDEDERTPLQRAVSAGKDEIVQLLLSRGAKVNHLDNGGATALHFA